ncbi:winged helix-turn-helix transcriptional regulator [Candidatus Woesearchaeota archaeon]|nr:winged helix-turn-helix transcriptional regulator [Candidatus Woesearchaeota archaeon]
MENKKLGIILVLISLIVGSIFVYFIISLAQQSQQAGCFDNKDCFAIEKGLSISHVAIGIFSFIFALGFYLLLFNKTEKAILTKLENEKREKIEYAKFEMLMRALDSFEQQVIKAIREQDGITQNTLKLRLNMSKAKLSYVLQELEKKGIVKRIKKGKTLAVYLRI